ncbi:MAG: Rne/Rng family ribonuclease [Candidatus Marinimicrobia bacterium]|jgi:ribonuclease G|nr:Rne/Rng family ribonuclease [Candidatus Neomarinimicrobiota bacterium]MBT3631878.1 Rne/Rng family ribonuclease [Candidatus Neomarinimicrobiota bacterium]MBT4131117.1 Rne/Rng family ribonuclease [Candidatus Neomarinimicrobiota bacterium]MBT4992066.1 Rne/Rng family ribonuclease [Candidatus Neomarinimicrobiota bacterium]MBT5466466.1 Rne/Rng family ribonuclease [Candidatus Neomarinimicrobiota bacterium]
MKKDIFINQTQKETRIAIHEDDVLVELYVEKPENIRIVGNIYKGVVENVLPGMQAAFVDIGIGANAFLPFSEVKGESFLLDQDDDEDAKPRQGNRGRSRNQKHRHDHRRPNAPKLKTGQQILVQVIKEPYMGKGARVTTNISLPGRFLVLVPNSNSIGISRKIYNNYERRRLRRSCQEMKPDGFGLIARTVTEGKDDETLGADLNNLMDSYKRMEKVVKSKPGPVLVYKDMETVSSLIRDLFTNDVQRVVTDSKGMYKQINSYLKGAAPQLLDRLIHYKKKLPLFDAYHVQKGIDISMARKVGMKSGASIVIEQTEALVSIDVNSGKFIGRKDHEANAVKINLEAARAIAQQLRLRDLGGLIVIDFIDMSREDNKKKVYYELRRELRKDRAKVAVSYISDFGLLEMTRQRIRLSLLLSATEECPVCKGRGRIMSKAALTTQIEGWFRRFHSKKREFRLQLVVNPELAKFLRSGRKNVVRSIQWQHFIKVEIVEDESKNMDEFRVISKKQSKDITDDY